MASRNPPVLRAFPDTEFGLLEGYAAIDPGSTATRAVIAVVQVDNAERIRKVVDTVRIQDFSADDDRNRRFSLGEWPSKCCPFDGPPYYVGYDADSQDSKMSISIKAIPYFRTRDDDGHPFTKALYDYAKSLPSEIAREHFNDTLDAILFKFLCEETRVKLRSLALCVPQTWSRRETPIQEYLSPILDKTVAGKGIETTFALEAQCQAQNLISRYPEELRDCNDLTVLDFGGHSMGGSHNELHWGVHGDRPRFHAPPESDFGVRGGYELWEIGIGRCIDNFMARNPRKFAQDRRQLIKSVLLNAFFNGKAFINFDNPHRLHADLIDKYNDSKASYMVTITAEQLKEEWESAFREAIDLAAYHVRRVVNKGERLKVLLTGGRSNNRKVRSEMVNVCTQLCEQGYDVTCKVVAKEMDVVLAPKWSIAEGAACCHATAMDVEEFFDLGAAFALQTLTTTAIGGDWAAESGDRFFCKQDGIELHSKIDIDIDGAKRKFRIIANPFQMVSGEFRHSNILARDSYDVWDLLLEYLPSSGGEPLPIPNGRHILEVAEMVYNGREAILILRMLHVPDISSSVRRSVRIQKRLAIDDVSNWSLLFDVPLTSSGPSNLIELDIDRIRGRYWKLESDLFGSPPAQQQGSTKREGTITGGYAARIAGGSAMTSSPGDLEQLAQRRPVELDTPSPRPAKRRRIDSLFVGSPDPLGS